MNSAEFDECWWQWRTLRRMAYLQVVGILCYDRSTSIKLDSFAAQLSLSYQTSLNIITASKSYFVHHSTLYTPTLNNNIIMHLSASLLLVAASLIGSALAWAPPRPPTPYPRPPTPDSGYETGSSNGRRRHSRREVDLVARHLSDLMEDLEIREANLARRELVAMEDEDALYI